MATDNSTPNSSSKAGGHSDYLTIAAFLQKTFTALTNGQLPDIAPLMTQRGISVADMAAKLLDGEALRTLNAQQQVEYGEQYGATEAYKSARTAIHEDYMDALGLARIVFKKDTAAKTALGLRGDRAQSQSGYAAQGLLFYKNALADPGYRTELAKKGVMQADLQAGHNAFQQLATLSAAQKKETGEAQAATKARDAAYDALAEWMSDFYETAKIALRKNPQLLEKLGIVQK